MSNTAFINRSLITIKNELEFLKDSGVITEAFYNELDRKFPSRYVTGSSPIDMNSNIDSTSEKQEYNSNPKPPPPMLQAAPPSSSFGEVAEVLYDYQPREPTDLALYKGAQVTILERLNADWWKGKDFQTGREGIFPSNYVRVNEPSAATSSSYQFQQPYGQAQPGYAPPSYNDNKQPPFPPSSTNYYQTPPQQQQQPAPQQVVEQPQQQSGAQSTLHKFGSKLGNAAIFGAGATIGSDLVNSIF